jgi:hypothetical protein
MRIGYRARGGRAGGASGVPFCKTTKVFCFFSSEKKRFCLVRKKQRTFDIL